MCLRRWGLSTFDLIQLYVPVQVGLEGDANAHLELPDGDLQPFHWIDEKRAKSCSARVVPRIGTQETFHTGWCGSLNLEQVRASFCSLHHLAVCSLKCFPQPVCESLAIARHDFLRFSHLAFLLVLPCVPRCCNTCLS